VGRVWRYNDTARKAGRAIGMLGRKKDGGGSYAGSGNGAAIYIVINPVDRSDK
jgi:hypothetical protein